MTATTKASPASAATREQLIRNMQWRARSSAHHAIWLGTVDYREDPFDQKLVNRVIKSFVEGLDWMLAHPEADHLGSKYQTLDKKALDLATKPKNKVSPREHRRTARTREILCERFPGAFKPKGEPKVPLKVGIGFDVHLSLPEIGWKALDIALLDYTSGPTYLQTLTFEASRFDIAGAPVGFVTGPEAVHAAERLARFGAWIARSGAHAEAT